MLSLLLILLSSVLRGKGADSYELLPYEILLFESLCLVSAPSGSRPGVRLCLRALLLTTPVLFAVYIANSICAPHSVSQCPCRPSILRRSAHYYSYSPAPKRWSHCRTGPKGELLRLWEPQKMDSTADLGLGGYTRSSAY